MADFKFEIDKEFGDHVIEERDNLSIIMRKISWGNSSDYKVDIRKYLYTEEGERMNKGISLTDNGANELTKELINTGYGDTKEIVKALSKRDDDFWKIVDDVKNNRSDEEESEEYYDPKELLS